MKSEDEIREDFELIYINNGNNKFPRPTRLMCGKYWFDHVESRWVAFKFAYNLYAGA